MPIFLSHAAPVVFQGGLLVITLIPAFESAPDVTRIQSEYVANRYKGKKPTAIIIEKPFFSLLTQTARAPRSHRANWEACNLYPL
jgi:hypothetical protein